MLYAGGQQLALRHVRDRARQPPFERPLFSFTRMLPSICSHVPTFPHLASHTHNRFRCAPLFHCHASTHCENSPLASSSSSSPSPRPAAPLHVPFQPAKHRTAWHMGEVSGAYTRGVARRANARRTFVRRTVGGSGAWSQDVRSRRRAASECVAPTRWLRTCIRWWM